VLENMEITYIYTRDLAFILEHCLNSIDDLPVVSHLPNQDETRTQAGIHKFG